MSSFDNLPLPAIQDNQDYVRLVPANSTVEIPAVGEFVYCKFSDASVLVEINGKTTEMEPGDIRRMGGGTVFRGVKLINRTNVNKATVFVIGFGDFDRKIVQGEISITPVLRRADGTTKEDTREQIDILLRPEELQVTSYNKNDIIKNAVRFEKPGSPGQYLIPQHIFAGPGGLPISSYVWSGFADGGYVQYDNNLNKLKTDTSVNISGYNPYYNGAATDAGWSPTHGFIVARVKELRKCGSGNTKTVIYNSPGLSEITSICYHPARNTILVSSAPDGKIEELDEKTLTLLRTLDMGFTFGAKAALRYDWFTGELYFAYNFDRFRKYDIETQTIGPSITGFASSTLNTVAGFVKVDNAYFSSALNSSAGPKKVAFEDFTTKPVFTGVAPNCDMTSALIYPEFLPQVTASFTTEQLTTGVAFSGEVIKAALEFYFKRAMPDDYLDHVYMAKLGKDITGREIKPISSGNTTFAAFDIVDDFEIITPSVINLLIDSELELGVAL